jgi:pyrroloquinoline quinone (PQQ) biosynthesis protein C
MAHYVNNRRDCWGHVMGAAPLDVKRMIWAHEQEELIHDPRAGTDHSALALGEAGLVGLNREQVEQAELLPGAIAAFYAWIHLAKDRPWREAFAASSMLERRNDDAVIDGGGMSYRRGTKLARELGIPLERNPNATVHMEADVEHATMLDEVAARYAVDDEGRRALIRGARETYLIDRAFIGSIADALERLP